jgi:hypothetical protein
MKRVVLLAALLATPVLAQQIDPAKVAPFYRQQRDVANDGVAACTVIVMDLQAKIAELERKLAEAQPK